MSIENLTLVKGKSFEEIIKLLNAASVRYKIHSPPQKTNTHFREAYIRIHPDDKFRTEQLLGNPARKSRFSSFYYAMYKIEPNFDWTILSGNPNFCKGLLVESIGLEYKK